MAVVKWRENIKMAQCLVAAGNIYFYCRLLEVLLSLGLVRIRVRWSGLFYDLNWV